MPSKQEKMKAVNEIMEELKGIIEDAFSDDDPEFASRPAMDLIKDAIELYENFDLGGDR